VKTESARKHLIITGPGRSGTTLLVRLFDELGFETHAKQLPYYERARAGLEADILAADAPYVVKKPNVTWLLREMLQSGQLLRNSVEWLIVSLRDLDQAAASRMQITASSRAVAAPGGLRTRRPGKQRHELAETTYSLFQTAAAFELPVIVIEYPTFAKDSEYAYRRLEPALRNCTKAEFDRAWRAVVDPSLVRDRPIEVQRFVGTRIALIHARHALSVKLRAVARRIVR
jgi:hypothetical protein